MSLSSPSLQHHRSIFPSRYSPIKQTFDSFHVKPFRQTISPNTNSSNVIVVAVQVSSDQPAFLEIIASSLLADMMTIKDMEFFFKIQPSSHAPLFIVGSFLSIVSPDLLIKEEASRLIAIVGVIQNLIQERALSSFVYKFNCRYGMDIGGSYVTSPHNASCQLSGGSVESAISLASVSLPDWICVSNSIAMHVTSSLQICSDGVNRPGVKAPSLVGPPQEMPCLQREPLVSISKGGDMRVSDETSEVISTDIETAIPNVGKRPNELQIVDSHSLFILIIDDSTEAISTLIRCVGNLGIRYSTETTLSKALPLMKSGVFDVLVVNYNLSKQAMLNIVARIRSVINEEEQPIIVLIHDVTFTEQDEERCRDLSVDYFLPAPLDIKFVTKVLQRFELELSGVIPTTIDESPPVISPALSKVNSQLFKRKVRSSSNSQLFHELKQGSDVSGQSLLKSNSRSNTDADAPRAPSGRWSVMLVVSPSQRHFPIKELLRSFGFIVTIVSASKDFIRLKGKIFAVFIDGDTVKDILQILREWLQQQAGLGMSPYVVCLHSEDMKLSPIIHRFIDEIVPSDLNSEALRSIMSRCKKYCTDFNIEDAQSEIKFSRSSRSKITLQKPVKRRVKWSRWWAWFYNSPWFLVLETVLVILLALFLRKQVPYFQK